MFDLTGGYNDHPPGQYDDHYSNDGRGTPQRGPYDEDIPRSVAALVNNPPRDQYSDGRQTPSVHGEGKVALCKISLYKVVVYNYLEQLSTSLQKMT